MNKSLKILAFGVLAATSVSACGGGGGGGGIFPPPAPSASPSTAPGALSVNPASVFLDAIGATQTLTISEPGFAGAFKVDTTTCSAFASISGSNNGPHAALTLKSIAAGSCTITVSDGAGRNQNVSLTVTSTSGVIQ